MQEKVSYILPKIQGLAKMVLLQSVLGFHFHHFSTILSHNEQTCQRGAIEMNKRGKSHDFLINISLFPPKELTRTKKDITQRFVMGKSYIFFPVGNSLDSSHNFQHLSSGSPSSCCQECKITFNLTSQKGCFKNESLNKYQIIKKNVLQGLYILGEQSIRDQQQLL